MPFLQSIKESPLLHPSWLVSDRPWMGHAVCMLACCLPSQPLVYKELCTTAHCLPRSPGIVSTMPCQIPLLIRV